MLKSTYSLKPEKYPIQSMWNVRLGEQAQAEFRCIGIARVREQVKIQRVFVHERLIVLRQPRVQRDQRCIFFFKFFKDFMQSIQLGITVGLTDTLKDG